MYLLLVVGLKLSYKVSLFDIPNEDLPICGAGGEQRVVLLCIGIAPLDGCHCATCLSSESVFGRAAVRLPDADVAVGGATSEELARGVPCDLLDFSFMTFPSHDRLARLIHIPEMNESALSSHGNIFTVLPLYLKTFEIWVNVSMLKSGDFSVGLWFAVPDVDCAEEPTGSDEVACVTVVEFGIHEDVLEVLHSLDLYFARLLDLPHSGHLVRRAREYSVSFRMPVDGADLC